MEYVEVEGSSIDEAIELALARLGVTRDRAQIEILSHSATGLFGLGGRRARVRASLRGALEADETSPCVLTDSDTPVEGAGPAVGTALEQGRALLQEILRRMAVRAEVVVEEGGLTIRGDGSGVLIGRRGQTLDALEHLVNRIVGRDEVAARIAVDCEGYRRRRKEALEDLARRLGESARRRGKTVTLNPMSPRDRRIVHLALRDDPTLTTRSIGEGHFRKLLIIPRSEQPRRGRERRR